jgi:hypothetical protein
MKIEVIIYTETNGHRNSLDTPHTDLKAAMREIEKAIKEGKDIQVKVNDKKKLERNA